MGEFFFSLVFNRGFLQQYSEQNAVRSLSEGNHGKYNILADLGDLPQFRESDAAADKSYSKQSNTVNKQGKYRHGKKNEGIGEGNRLVKYFSKGYLLIFRRFIVYIKQGINEESSMNLCHTFYKTDSFLFSITFTSVIVSPVLWVGYYGIVNR